MSIRNSRRAGFTLIEIMIVIAIIAVLAAVTIPNYVVSRNQAKLSSCKQNLRSLASGLESFATAHDGRYPTHLNRLVPDYIKSIPKCPMVGSALPYVDGFQHSTSPDNYTVQCQGANHTVLELPENFPQYNAAAGLKDR